MLANIDYNTYTVTETSLHKGSMMFGFYFMTNGNMFVYKVVHHEGL